jgi:hypothetical protein
MSPSIEKSKAVDIFDDYRIRVVNVLRDYTMTGAITGRDDVPADSIDAHQG